MLERNRDYRISQLHRIQIASHSRSQSLMLHAWLVLSCDIHAPVQFAGGPMSVDVRPHETDGGMLLFPLIALN